MNTTQEQLQQVKQQMRQQTEPAPAATKPAQRPANTAKIAPRPTGAEKPAKKSQPGAGGWKSPYIQRAQSHYPQVFNRRKTRPMKVGIRADMLADAAARCLPLTPKQISRAVAGLTKTPIYLRAIVAGGPRYDLNGQPCGEVTTEQQENARRLLVTLKASGKKKRSTGQ
ncbi:ProQ/FinO family protein [Serratia sp. PL7]|uniref:ProQ/FinO family protein n=1 Tax=Serratia sp. PL7 TaxID=2952201 RepID=UPI0021AD8FDF|nr:ProQ/FinO family protein [Serratia sp. PL7]